MILSFVLGKHETPRRSYVVQQKAQVLPVEGGRDGNHLDLRVTMNSHSRHVNAYSQMMIASLRFHDKYKNCLLNPRFELHFA